MSSTAPGARDGLPPSSTFLFSEIPLDDTVEELERVYRRRKETARTLGEEGKGQQLDEAYAMARACLQAVLDEAHAPESSLIAPRSSEASPDAAATGGDTPGVASETRETEPQPGSSSPDPASGDA